MAKKRIPVAVDVVWDEVGNTYYQLIEPGKAFAVAPVPGLSQGIFINECDLDEWLEEHASKVVVTKDYRIKED